MEVNGASLLYTVGWSDDHVRGFSALLMALRPASGEAVTPLTGTSQKRR